MNRTIRIYLSVTPEEECRSRGKSERYHQSAKDGRKSRNQWIVSRLMEVEE